MNVTPAAYLPVGSHTSNSSLSSAVPITTPADSQGVLAQALTQNIRFKIDGTAATTTAGFQLKAGDPPTLIPVAPFTVISFIEETATANLQYQAVKTMDTVG